MIGLKIKYDAKSLDKRLRKNLVSQHMHSALSGLWKEAIREFIKAIVIEEVVKVDTGMAMGNLIPLAKAVRMATEVQGIINSRRKRTGVQWYATGPRSYNRYGFKNERTGERISQDSYNVETGSAKNPHFVFDFEIKVFHYICRENGINGKDPGSIPWDSILKGRHAFLQYINSQLPQFQLLINAFVADGTLKPSPWGK